MIKNAKSLKDKARNISKENEVSIQQVLQNYMFERVLERLSKSKYKNNFIIKGGVLLSSMMGINLRTTMDIDTNVTGINFEEDELIQIVTEILSINTNDNTSFEINNSRMKDYYDLYFFVKYRWNKINKEVLSEAIIKTFTARNSINELRDIDKTIVLIKNNQFLNKLWIDYALKHSYANDVTFLDTVEAINIIKNEIFANKKIQQVII